MPSLYECCGFGDHDDPIAHYSRTCSCGADFVILVDETGTYEYLTTQQALEKARSLDAERVLHAANDTVE